MRDELHNSNKVRLDGLGTFYIGLKTSGALEADEFNPKENIKGFNVKFLAEAHRNGNSMSRTFTEGYLREEGCRFSAVVIP